METKISLRESMKEKLSCIDEESFTHRSSLVSKNLSILLSSLHIIQEQICIGCFAPIAKEPLWYLHLSTEFEKLTAYPSIEIDTQKMIFKKAHLADLEIKNDFGFKILGPAEKSQVVKPGILLVPGLVFTAKGERLGRGKGFYDKYLSEFSGIKIGICFKEQVLELIPIEEHDQRLDYIVTDEKIIKREDA